MSEYQQLPRQLVNIYIHCIPNHVTENQIKMIFEKLIGKNCIKCIIINQPLFSHKSAYIYVREWFPVGQTKKQKLDSEELKENIIHKHTTAKIITNYGIDYDNDNNKYLICSRMKNDIINNDNINNIKLQIDIVRRSKRIKNMKKKIKCAH